MALDRMNDCLQLTSILVVVRNVGRKHDVVGSVFISRRLQLITIARSALCKEWSSTVGDKVSCQFFFPYKRLTPTFPHDLPGQTRKNAHRIFRSPIPVPTAQAGWPSKFNYNLHLNRKVPHATKFEFHAKKVTREVPLNLKVAGIEVFSGFLNMVYLCDYFKDLRFRT